MQCPNCSHELKQVSAKSHYGAIIKLNQCFCCGGIWFNDWELFALDDEEAKVLDNIDAEKLKIACGISPKEKICPECNMALEKFRDANIPEEIDIESCRRCGGFWLNRGKTTEYKEYQQEKIKQSLFRQEQKLSDINGDEFTRNIQSLLGSERTGTYDAIGRLGKYLSMPVNSSITKPIRGIGGNNIDSSVGNTAYLAVEILNIILRLLIGR